MSHNPNDLDQMSVKEGDELIVLDRVNESWWWVELGGVAGYVPANHLSCDPVVDPEEDRWQDDEYFSSYNTLVCHFA